MGLTESRISGNFYDKYDRSKWMQALDFADVQKTTYFDVDEVVYMDKKYFSDDLADTVNKWSDVFAQ